MLELPVFVINLERYEERKSHIKKICSEYGLIPYFIEAVDGQKMKEADISKVYSKKESIRVFGRELSKNEVACALSHKSIYKQIIESNIPFALILEDDVEFNTDLLNVIHQVIKQRNKWEVVLLGHHKGQSRYINTSTSLWGRIKILHDYRLERPIELAYGAYGYLLNTQGAIKLLNCPIVRPLDHYTGDDTKVNVFVLNPPVINIQVDLSDSSSAMSDREELDFAYRLASGSEPIVWYKRFTRWLGIHNFLSKLKEKSRLSFRMIKPIKKYE